MYVHDQTEAETKVSSTMSYYRSNKPPTSSLVQYSGFDSSSLRQYETSDAYEVGGQPGTYRLETGGLARTDELIDESHLGGIYSLMAKKWTETGTNACCGISFNNIEAWKHHRRKAHGKILFPAEEQQQQQQQQVSDPIDHSFEKPQHHESRFQNYSRDDCLIFRDRIREHFQIYMAKRSSERKGLAETFREEINDYIRNMKVVIQLWKREKQDEKNPVNYERDRKLSGLVTMAEELCEELKSMEKDVARDRLGL